jgi:caffeoyl-CoA O-methyltransferase
MPSSPPQKGFGQGDPDLAQWAMRTFEPEDDVLREIRERAQREGLPTIAVGQMDGLHLEVLARAIGARTAVEIGTLGGYSGVCLLRGMGSSGVLHTFELSEHHAQVARESFKKAGFEGRAQIHVGPALSKLDEVKGEVDLVFIDADKISYPDYLQWSAEHLRMGGIVLADNAFAFGEVHLQSGDAGVQAIRKFNEQLAQSGRFRATMLPTAEGLAMGVKVK